MFRIDILSSGTARVVLFSVYTLCSRTTWHTPAQLVSISTVYFRLTWHPAGPLGWYSSKYTLFIFELLGTCLHNWGDNYRISAALGRCCMQRDRRADAHQSPHCLVHICIYGADQNLDCLLQTDVGSYSSVCAVVCIRTDFPQACATGADQILHCLHSGYFVCAETVRRVFVLIWINTVRLGSG